MHDDALADSHVLHQCGRATMEGLYVFRDTAEVVVASEVVVGAPNSYYRPVLERLGREPDMTSAALGKAILDTERHAATTGRTGRYRPTGA